MLDNLFEIKFSQLNKTRRLEPRVYFYEKFYKESFSKMGLKVINLGDEESFSVSDGEHHHLKRQKSPGIRYLYGRNIKEGEVNFDEVSDSPYISANDFNNHPRIHLNNNDILLTIVGTIGRSAVYREDIHDTCGIPRHIAKITVKNNKISPYFISAFLRSKVGKLQQYSLITGNNQPLLSLRNIKLLDIPLLKKNDLELVTQNEEKQIKLQIEAKKALDKMNVLSKRIFPDLQPFKNKTMFYESNLNSIIEEKIFNAKFRYPSFVNNIELLNKSYSCHKLDELCDMKSGDEVGSKNYIDYFKKSKEDIKFIRTTDITNHCIDHQPDFYVNKHDIKEAQENMEGDILFTKDGKIGVTGMITSTDKCFLASGIERIRLKKDLSTNITAEYIFFCLRMNEIGRSQALMRTVYASTIPHLREDRLGKVLIPEIQKNKIQTITALVREYFEKKSRQKVLMESSEKILENYNHK
tara:strand:+ start:1593 stop:2996 length:1404 start_codon:yes stop_codon:yes gene_type:complete